MVNDSHPLAPPMCTKCFSKQKERLTRERGGGRGLGIQLTDEDGKIHRMTYKRNKNDNWKHPGEMEPTFDFH